LHNIFYYLLLTREGQVANKIKVINKKEKERERERGRERERERERGRKRKRRRFKEQSRKEV